jgi:hypothetical protein
MIKLLTPEQARTIEEIISDWPGFTTSYMYKHHVTNLNDASFDSLIEHFGWLQEVNSKPTAGTPRPKPDTCDFNFKDKPWCEFSLVLSDKTYGFCKKCKRDYVLENAKFGKDRYDILEGTWTVIKYDLEKALDCYGGTLGVKWANSVLEDSDMWQDSVIEFAQNILKGNPPETIQLNPKDEVFLVLNLIG